MELVTAAGIVAEVGSFGRFATAPEFMGYLGVVPSEDSTGETHHRGRITRTGNQHVRWLLVESAWHYRHKPRLTKAIRERSKGVAAGVLAIAWKTNRFVAGCTGWSVEARHHRRRPWRLPASWRASYGPLPGRSN